MASLASLPEVVGFFSYSREDDEAFKGALSTLRGGIQRELSAQLGRSKRSFRLWQDQEAIAPGKLWETEMKTAVEQSVFFIPIVTPRTVNSQYCKFEFDSFLAREKTLGRTDLVFPILYIALAALEHEAQWRADPVLSIIGSRQYVDWRPLRHLDIDSTAVREATERFCGKIVEALNEPSISPEERQIQEERGRQEAEAQAQRKAEDELLARETQKRRRTEEEERRNQAQDALRADQGQALTTVKRAESDIAVDDVPGAGLADEPRTTKETFPTSEDNKPTTAPGNFSKSASSLPFAHRWLQPNTTTLQVLGALLILNLPIMLFVFGNTDDPRDQNFAYVMGTLDCVIV
jgi:hypothetical protein